jgi:protein-S-isoprenylcysteine O-methyltransferase Ste14
MQKSLQSLSINFIFVFVQFGGIAIIFLTGPVLCSQKGLLSIQTIGFILGIWAIIVMKINNLSVLPKLKANAKFVYKGPYRLIRHPMYLAIILTIVPLIICKYSVFRMIVFSLILFDLILKSFYEESLLKKQFINYTEYSKKTYRIFPFIF